MSDLWSGFRSDVGLPQILHGTRHGMNSVLPRIARARNEVAIQLGEIGVPFGVRFVDHHGAGKAELFAAAHHDTAVLLVTQEG